MHYSENPLLSNLPPGSLAATEPVKPGRPTAYEKGAVIEKILDLVAETNLSLREICKQHEDLPSIRTLYRWMSEDDEFFVTVNRLQHLRCDDLAWDCLKVAEDGDRDITTVPDDEGMPHMVVNKEHIARTQMRLDQMHYVIEQIRPERYGDKRFVQTQSAKVTEITVEAEILRIEDHPNYPMLAAYRAAAEGK